MKACGTDMITPPFANYELAHLERLIQETYERIERVAYKQMKNHQYWGYPTNPPISHFEFQVLLAAEKYVKQMRN
jgi:hypothetical protein